MSGSAESPAAQATLSKNFDEDELEEVIACASELLRVNNAIVRRTAALPLTSCHRPLGFTVWLAVSLPTSVTNQPFRLLMDALLHAPPGVRR